MSVGECRERYDSILANSAKNDGSTDHLEDDLDLDDFLSSDNEDEEQKGDNLHQSIHSAGETIHSSTINADDPEVLSFGISNKQTLDVVGAELEATIDAILTLRKEGTLFVTPTSHGMSSEQLRKYIESYGNDSSTDALRELGGLEWDNSKGDDTLRRPEDQNSMEIEGDNRDGYVPSSSRTKHILLFDRVLSSLGGPVAAAQGDKVAIPSVRVQKGEQDQFFEQDVNDSNYLRTKAITDRRRQLLGAGKYRELQSNESMEAELLAELMRESTGGNINKVSAVDGDANSRVENIGETSSCRQHRIRIGTEDQDIRALTEAFFQATLAQSSAAGDDEYHSYEEMHRALPDYSPFNPEMVYPDTAEGNSERLWDKFLAEAVPDRETTIFIEPTPPLLEEPSVVEPERATSYQQQPSSLLDGDRITPGLEPIAAPSISTMPVDAIGPHRIASGTTRASRGAYVIDLPSIVNSATSSIESDEAAIHASHTGIPTLSTPPIGGEDVSFGTRQARHAGLQSLHASPEVLLGTRGVRGTTIRNPGSRIGISEGESPLSSNLHPPENISSPITPVAGRRSEKESEADAELAPSLVIPPGTSSRVQRQLIKAYEQEILAYNQRRAQRQSSVHVKHDIDDVAAIHSMLRYPRQETADTTTDSMQANTQGYMANDDSEPSQQVDSSSEPEEVSACYKDEVILVADEVGQGNNSLEDADDPATTVDVIMMEGGEGSSYEVTSIKSWLPVRSNSKPKPVVPNPSLPNPSPIEEIVRNTIVSSAIPSSLSAAHPIKRDSQFATGVAEHIAQLDEPENMERNNSRADNSFPLRPVPSLLASVSTSISADPDALLRLRMERAKKSGGDKGSSLAGEGYLDINAELGEASSK